MSKFKLDEVDHQILDMLIDNTRIPFTDIAKKLLISAGTVTLSEDGQTVRLQQPSYQPLAGSEDQIAYLSRNLGDHAQAAVENVQGREPPHFERAVHYTGLTEAQVAALAARFNTAQMALFREISQTAAEMKRGNATPGLMRFRAGGYFFRTEDTE